MLTNPSSPPARKAKRRVFFRCNLESIARVIRYTREWDTFVHGPLIESDASDTWVEIDRHGNELYWFRGEHDYRIKAPWRPGKRERADVLLVSHEDSNVAAENAHRYTTTNKKKGAVVNRYEHEFSNGICHKAKLAFNMWDVYKEHAWQKIPRTFVMPRKAFYDEDEDEFSDSEDDEDFDSWYKEFMASADYASNLSLDAFFKEVAHEKQKGLPFDETLWILKPSTGLEGKGIRVFSSQPPLGKVEMAVRDHVALNEDIRDRKGKYPYAFWVMQKYIPSQTVHPGHTTDQHKFDLRMYALSVSDDEGKGADVYLHREGFLRLAMDKMSYDKATLSNNKQHTTNTAKFKGSKGHHASGEGNNPKVKLNPQDFVLPIAELQRQLLVEKGVPWQVRTDADTPASARAGLREACLVKLGIKSPGSSSSGSGSDGSPRRGGSRKGSRKGSKAAESGAAAADTGAADKLPPVGGSGGAAAEAAAAAAARKGSKGGGSSVPDGDAALKSSRKKGLVPPVLFDQMCDLVRDSVDSVRGWIAEEEPQDSHGGSQAPPGGSPKFQWFGYDFVIDRKGKVWLLEVNAKPKPTLNVGPAAFNNGPIAGPLDRWGTGAVPCSTWEIMDDMVKLAVDPYLEERVGSFVDESFGTKQPFKQTLMQRKDGTEEHLYSDANPARQEAWLKKYFSEDRRTSFALQDGRWRRKNGFRPVGSNWVRDEPPPVASSSSK